MNQHPDLLRSPSNVFDPDPRSIGFNILDAQGLRPKTLQDQYESVAAIVLHGGVPRGGRPTAPSARGFLPADTRSHSADDVDQPANIINKGEVVGAMRACWRV
jgi:hypothetical protein